VRPAWFRLFEILRLFFSSKVRNRAILWAALLISLLLLMNGLNVVNSYVGRDFMTAIADHQPGRYATSALVYLGVFACSTIAAVFSRFSEERLRLLWRAWLTGTLIDRYLSDHACFRLGAREEIDNPDERITEDAKSYTQTTLSFFIMSLNSTLTSVAFLGVLWSITPRLVAVAFVYAMIGSVSAIFMGRRLVRLNNLQLKKEADLRYALIQVRDQSLSVIVTDAAQSMKERLHERLRAVIENTRMIVSVTRNLGFVTVGYNYLIQLVPLLVVAPLYLQGKVEFGVVTQSAMAFSQVIGAFSLIVTQFEALSSFVAVNERLNTIWEAIDQACVPSESALELAEDEQRVAFENLTLEAPNSHQPLVRDLSLSLPRGRNLLVVGPNDAAKNALFMATAKVWEEGEGRIIRPRRERMIFLSQQPVLARGTLRQRLSSFAPGTEFSEDRLSGALHDVGLDPVLERVGGWDKHHDPATEFSPHEQQLLKVARLLLAKPQFVFLNKVHESLSPDEVDLLYRRLTESSINYLTVGDEKDLGKYHDTVLEIGEDGGWQVRPSGEKAGRQ
jgi:putative ATP-binding cassette transporter